MIAIYPVRAGSNPELRMSLRSLHNLPQVQAVWIVGDMPQWCQPDLYLPGNPYPQGPANVYYNVWHACERAAHLGYTEVLIMNDDFMVTERVTEVQPMHRMTLSEHLAIPAVRDNPTHWWTRSLYATQAALQAHGHRHPVSYELHAPFLCDPAAMADTLADYACVTPDNPPQWRTLYGNEHGYQRDTTQHADGKVYGPGQMKRPYMSTTDNVFPSYANTLVSMFPTTSPWEKNAQ